MQNIRKDLSIKTMTIVKPWKQVVLFTVGLVGLIVFSLILNLIMVAIAKASIPSASDYEVFIKGHLADMILNGTTYVVIASVFIIVLRNDSDELFKSFKSWRAYVAGAIGLAAIMSFNVIYNIILSSTGVLINDNANESSLNSIISVFPFASILIFGLIGPFVEELTYRVGLFSLTRRVNRIFAYIVTIIVFTLIHFDFTSATITNELLNIPFYAFAGLTFTFLYEKYGLAGSLSAHVSNNLLSIGTAIFATLK